MTFGGDHIGCRNSEKHRWTGQVADRNSATKKRNIKVVPVSENLARMLQAMQHDELKTLAGVEVNFALFDGHLVLSNN